MGTYVPSCRLHAREIASHWSGAAGAAARAVTGWDEDVVTMGVEAATLAMQAGAIDIDDIDAVVLATTTAPYGEHSAAAEVARALGARRNCRAIDLGASVAGAVSALLIGHALVQSGAATAVLVIGADDRAGEPGGPLEATVGAGAAAAVVGHDAGIRIVAHAAQRHGVPTRWRAADSPWILSGDDPRFEREGVVGPALRDAAETAMAQAGWTPDALAFVFFGTDARLAGSIAKACKCAPEVIVESADAKQIGDAGNAAPLLALASAWGKFELGGRGLIAGVAPGAASEMLAVELVAPASVASVARAPVTVDYVEYLRRRGVVGRSLLPDPVMAYSTGPAAARDESLAALAGDRCMQCGSLNIPPRVFCIDCGGEDFARVRIARTGTLVTFNEQHVVAVAPDPAPLVVGVVRVDGTQGVRGGNLSVMLTDTDPGEVRIGGPVELVMRRCGVEQGLVKYGWKARARREETP
ncbi:MAG: OB-fold domain-containing protein [Acidimicrobiia bacterium]